MLKILWFTILLTNNSETVVVKTTKKPSIILPTITLICSGLFGAGAGGLKYLADDSYESYQSSSSTAQAIDYRDKTEKYDKYTLYSAGGAGAMGLVSAGLWVRYFILKGRHKKVGMKWELRKDILCVGICRQF